MLVYMGYIAIFFSIYNIFSGMVARLASQYEASRVFGVEASIWFVAASFCLK